MLILMICKYLIFRSFLFQIIKKTLIKGSKAVCLIKQKINRKCKNIVQMFRNSYIDCLYILVFTV